MSHWQYHGKKGADIASAAPLVIGNGDFFDVTGTTDFAAMTVGGDRMFALQFDGILTITHGASLLLPGAANITTAAGDVAVFQSTAADTVVCVSYTKADGTAVVAPAGATFAANVETLAAAKTIADGDPEVQILNPGGANRDVYLPATPAADARFTIVNDDAFGDSVYLQVLITGDTNYFTQLYAGNSATFIFDSTDGLWRCVGPGFVRTRTAANTYSTQSLNTAVGNSANGSTNGAALGYAANGSSYGAAVGSEANGSTTGAAVGRSANGSSQGAALGNLANGSSSGAAVGSEANGSTSGAAVGSFANGSSQGAALGLSAVCNSKRMGSAIGYQSQQQRYGGHAASGDHLSTNKLHREEVMFKGSTANDTATELFLHGVSANRCTILASSAVAFKGIAVAKEAATGDTKVWEFSGAIKRDAANNTALIGTITYVVVAADAGAAAWDMVISADDTNEALLPTVTGEAARTIAWGIQAILVDLRT